MLALHCDNGFLHMYLPFFSATLKYAAETTRECDYEGQGTDRVSVEGLFFRFISHLCFFFFLYSTRTYSMLTVKDNQIHEQWT